MGLSAPDDPSLLDRAYLFLTSRLSCWAALACLFGGFLCVHGIVTGQLWAIVIGAVLMAPYALAATIFVSFFIGAVVFAFCLMMFFNWREWLERRNAKRKR